VLPEFPDIKSPTRRPPSRTDYADVYMIGCGLRKYNPLRA